MNLINKIPKYVLDVLNTMAGIFILTVKYNLLTERRV